VVSKRTGEKEKIGWSLDESKQTDYILYRFDPDDCRNAYLIAFQHLRAAFRKYYHDWIDRYHEKPQATNGRSGEWQSLCVFVPVSIVRAAVHEQESLFEKMAIKWPDIFVPGFTREPIQLGLF